MFSGSLKMELTGQMEPAGEEKMKKTLLAIVLAAATMPFTFAAPANPQATDQSTTKTKKHAKKHAKKAKAPKSSASQK